MGWRGNTATEEAGRCVGTPSYRYDLEQYWAAAPHNVQGVAVIKDLAAAGIRVVGAVGGAGWRKSQGNEERAGISDCSHEIHRGGYA